MKLKSFVLLRRRGVSVCAAVAGVLVVAVCGAGVRGADGDAGGAWKSLPLVAEGKVAPGWVHVGYGGFVVDEGALRTEPSPKGLGLLVYEKERLGNCQVRVVFKTKDEKSNSGVYVRIGDGILDQVKQPGAAFERDAAGKPSKESLAAMEASSEREEGAWYAVHHGYEVQIADGGDATHGTGSIYSLAPRSGVPQRGGEWRTMVITLAGTRVAVDLDGKRVTTFDSAAKDLPPRKLWHEPKREHPRPEVGYLGLQTHDPGDIVWFKEVSVRALPAGGGGGGGGTGQIDLRPALRQAGLTARQQGARGTCSVFTMVSAMEYALAEPGRTSPRLSVEYLNWASNEAVGHAADGGFFSDLWKGYRERGICNEDEMPYADRFDPERKPSDAVIASAKEHAGDRLQLKWIKRWNVRTGLTPEQLASIQETLAAGKPVCGGFRWPKKEAWPNGILAMRPPEAVYDGHSVLLVGCNEDAAQPGGGTFTFQNTNRPEMECRMTWEYALAYMNDAAWVERVVQ